MIVGDLKNSIDSLWLRFHTGGVTNPIQVIEQITYLLFIKRLDDLEIAKEKKAHLLGTEIEHPIFNEEQQELRWSKFKNLEAETMFNLVRTRVFDFIKTLGGEDTPFANYMKNAYLSVPTPVVLEQVVSMISAIPMDDMDTKGDVYEYMLSKLSTAKTAGQFRTPRHITRLMVELMKPTPDESICDPACGSAGFLISASEYIREHYPQSFYDTTFQEHYKKDMFHGCEFDDTMIRIAAMNLILHGVESPDLYDRSALDEIYDKSDCYSLILANPPFKGTLDGDTVSKSLKSVVHTKKTELLFLALMLRLLETGGRCAVIVPDGVLFGNDNAARTIRKTLVDDQKLEAVISMPSGVFRPYAGVSSAILIFTKTESGGTDKVWYYDMRADGFTLNDKRTPTEGSNDIPDILARYANLEAESARTRLDQSFFVPVEEIREKSYELSFNKYNEVVHEQKVYKRPAQIIEQIETLDKDRTELLKQLKVMLG